MNALLTALVIAAFLAIQALIGGTRLLFSLPCYGALGVAAVLTLFVRPAAGLKKVWLPVLSMALFTAWIAVRARFSPVDYLWWPDFYEVLACAIVYGLTAFYLGRPKTLAWLLGALLVLAIAESVVGFRQFSFGDNFMPFGLTRPPSGRRASGFFISPNHLAGLLEVAGVLALSFACWSNWRGWLRGLLFYTALICYGGIAVSGSRGGYLSVAASLIVFIFLSVAVIGSADRSRGLLLGLGCAVALTIAVVGGIQLMNQSVLLNVRLQSLSEQFGGGQLDWRVYNWQAAINQARLAPLTGTGAGTHLYYARFFRHARMQSDPVHAHSDYLELLAEYGVVGLGAALFFAGAHLHLGARRLRRVVLEEVAPTGLWRHHELALLLGVLSALAALAVHSVLDFNLHIPGNALLVAALFGVLAQPPEEAKTGRFSVLALVLPALGLGVCLSGLPRLPAEYHAEQMRKALLRGQYAAVIEQGRSGDESEKNYEVYFYLGEANRALASASPLRALRAPFFHAAVEDYRQSLALFAANSETWVRLGQALDGLRLFGEAEEAYLTALKLDPGLAITHAWYAAHLRLRGLEPQASAELKQAEILAGKRLDEVALRALDVPPPISPRP